MSRTRFGWLLALAALFAVGLAGLACGDDDDDDGGDDDLVDDDVDDDAEDDDATDDDTGPDDDADDDTDDDADDDDDTGPDDDTDDEPIDYDMGLLQNGDFEEEDAHWLQVSGMGLSLILVEDSAPVEAYSGDWLAWMGGYFNALDELVQRVQIPGGVTTGAFACYLNIRTEETFGQPYDHLYFKLRDDFGSDLMTVADLSNLDQTSGTWQLFSYDIALSSYAGQYVQFFLRATTDDSAHTDFFVDTCSFVVE